MAIFKSIFLVDDDEATNFYHQIVIEEWGKTERTYVENTGKSALDFLLNHGSFANEKPSLILLDINMPVMDGFEFLEAYSKLEDDLKASFVIVMLTSSLHPKDQERAKQFSDLKGYINKPLTPEQLDSLMEELQVVL
jgi:CheY-like chemotaxis protein